MGWSAGMAPVTSARKEIRHMIRDKSPAERHAYDKGIKAAVDAAGEAAITIACTENAGISRKRIVAGALATLAEAAEGLKLALVKVTSEAVLPPTNDPIASGEAPCPECAGRLQRPKDNINGHLHPRCETLGCSRILQ